LSIFNCCPWWWWSHKPCIRSCWYVKSDWIWKWSFWVRRRCVFEGGKVWSVVNWRLFVYAW